ncbi:MAG: YjgP/YjgQ family permease [Verrucomicrobiae bacterium]|nr:YjgP/YjgQ family permease [Verrucomicrobiae bacterium]
MRILERYLLREFLIPLVYCTFAFMLIMVVYDLFDNLPDFIQWRTPLGDVTWYYLTKTPSNIALTLPMAMLLALLYCLAMFAKNSELVAMRASGLSLRRLMLPYLGVGVGGSILLFLMNETIVPQSLDRANRFMLEQKAAHQQQKIAHQQKKSGFDPQQASKWAKHQRMTRLFFYNARDHRHWMIQEFDSVKRVLTNGIEVLQSDTQGKDDWKAMASWGKYLDGHWWFFDVKILDLRGDTTKVVESSRQRIMNELSETPKQLAAELKKPDQMTVKEIHSYLTLHQAMSTDRLAPFRVNLYQRFAQPWMCLIMVLLAVTMGARVGRKGPLVSVASSLAIFFVYWFVLQSSAELGKATYVEPFLAAWMPNLFFGTLGTFGYVSLR